MFALVLPPSLSGVLRAHLGLRLWLVLLCGVGFGVVATAKEDKRAEIATMRDRVVADMVALRPEVAGRLQRAEGYAVFSNVGVKILMASTASGRGVVTRQVNGREARIYMRMASLGVGFGFGVEDFRALFIFHDRRALEDFVTRGWDFSGQVKAAVKSDDKGRVLGGSTNALEGVEVFRLTKSGVVLQATLEGTKYWRDKKLNN